MGWIETLYLFHSRGKTSITQLHLCHSWIIKSCFACGINISQLCMLSSSLSVSIYFFGVNFYLYAYTCNAHCGDCYFAISRSKSIWPTNTIYFRTAAFSTTITGDTSAAFTVTVKVCHMAKMWGGPAFDQVDGESRVPALSWNTNMMTCIWCHFNADSDTGQFMVQFMSWLSYQGQASYKM